MAPSATNTARPGMDSSSATQSAARPSDAPLPSCSDRTLAEEFAGPLQSRGVQKRPFLKNKKAVVIARGGLMAADIMSSSYIAGGAAEFFFTEDLAVELSLDATRVALDLDEPLAEFFGDQRFEPSTGYLALAGLIWAPIHAKVKIGGDILRTDIMLTVGGGRLFHRSAQGMTFHAGAIIDLFTSRWVTVRFDVRDVVAVQEAVAETHITNNIVATLGVALWIPTGL